MAQPRGGVLPWSPGERAKAAAAYRHAVPLAEQELKVDPKNARILAHLADCHAMLDEADEARARGEQAGRLAPTDRRVAASLAGVYEHIGDRAAALHWLSVAFKAGQPRSEVESDPTFEKLRGDPRWLKLAKG